MSKSTYDRDKLWELIKANPWATNKELAEQLGTKAGLINSFKYQHRDEITKWITDNGLTPPDAKTAKKYRMPDTVETMDDKLIRLIHNDPTASNRQLSKLTGLSVDEVQKWRDTHRKEICQAFGDTPSRKSDLDVAGNQAAMERVLASKTVGNGKHVKHRRKDEGKAETMTEEMNGMIEALQDDKQMLTGEIDKLIAERDRLTEENETLKSQLSMMDGELNAERELRLEYARRMESERKLTEIERLKLIIADMTLERMTAV